MLQTRRWSIGFAAVLAAMAALAGQASAQTGPSVPPPPTYQAVDARGVDLVRNEIVSSTPSISVGPSGSGLSFQLTFVDKEGSVFIPNSPYGSTIYNGAAFRTSLDGATYENSTAFQTTVSIGGSSEVFGYTGTTTLTNVSGGGGRLSTPTGSWPATSYTYTAADGTVAVFGQPLGYVGIFLEGTKSTDLESLTKPDGEVLTYAYSPYTTPGYSVTLAHLQSVTSSRGYQIHLTYDPAYPSMLTKVMAIDTAVDACSPTINDCGSLAHAWPTLTVVTSATSSIAWKTSITDSLGRATVYSMDGNYGLTIQLPLRTALTRTVTPVTYVPGAAFDSISTVSDGAGTWQYTTHILSDGTPSGTTVTDPASHTRTVQLYPSTAGDLRSGRVTDDTDELGRHTHIDYTASGQILDIIHPEADSETYTYDDRGNLLATTKTGKPTFGGTLVTTAAYPTTPCAYTVTCNKPTSTTDANGNTTFYTYDTTHGGLLTATGPSVGGVQAQSRNTYSQITTVTSGAPVWRLTATSTCRTQSLAACVGTADEVKTTIGYTAVTNALPASVSTGAGDGSLTATASTTYDVVGNVASVTNPKGAVSSFVYDAARQQVGAIGPDPDGGGPLSNRATRTTYTSDGLVSLVEQGTASGGGWGSFSPIQSLATTYDGVDRKIQDVASGGGVQVLTQYNYDVFSRLNCTAVRLNPATFGAEPDACTLGTPGADAAADRISQNTYDASSQLTVVTQGLGTGSARAYDTITYYADGTKATEADANNNLTTYYYDGYNRLSQTNYPVPSGSGSNASDRENYGYDNVGNLTTRRVRDGTVLSMSFDALGRTTLDQNGATTGYDNLGHVTSSSLGGATVSIGYDALGRKTSETTSLGTITYQYDLAGGRTRITWPDGFYVAYGRDATEAVTTVTDSAGMALATYSYDNLGRGVGITRGNGVSSSYAYDGLSRLTALSHALATSTPSQNQSYSFGYNASGQISSQTSANSLYDSTPYTANRAYTNNGLNQMTTSGSYTLTYDARGNLTSDGVHTYTYNLVNQLVSATGVTLTYDGLGRLTRTFGSATTQFAYDGDQLLTEYDGAGAMLRRYIPGASGSDDPVAWYEGASTTDRRWLIDNQQGSVVGVTTSAGALLAGAANTYDEYGIPGGSNAGRFQYTGQIWIPELSLYHYKARTYSPTLGRFLQTDPIGYASDMNMYAYVGNDPVNGTDPSGMQCDTIPTRPDLPQDGPADGSPPSTGCGGGSGGGGGGWGNPGLSFVTFGGATNTAGMGPPVGNIGGASVINVKIQGDAVMGYLNKHPTQRGNLRANLRSIFGNLPDSQIDKLIYKLSDGVSIFNLKDISAIESIQPPDANGTEILTRDQNAALERALNNIPSDPSVNQAHQAFESAKLSGRIQVR